MSHRIAGALFLLSLTAVACSTKVTHLGDPVEDDDGAPPSASSPGEPAPAPLTSACNEAPVAGCAVPGESCTCSGYSCEAFGAFHDESCTLTCNDDFQWTVDCVADDPFEGAGGCDGGGGFGEGGYDDGCGGYGEGGFGGDGGFGEGGYGEGGFGEGGVGEGGFGEGGVGGSGGLGEGGFGGDEGSGGNV